MSKKWLSKYVGEFCPETPRKPGKSAELSQLSQLSQLSRKPKEEEGENSTYYYGKHRGEGNLKSPHIATPATPATVEGGCLTAFREEIEAWNPAAFDHGERLKDTALDFLTGQFAARAIELGWSDIELFGLFPGAPRHRFSAQGLVPSLAWSVHELELVALTADAAAFRTKRGATLRKPRRLTEPEISVPFWEADLSQHKDICP